MVGNSEGKMLLGNVRIDEKGIKICFREIGMDDVKWIHLAKDKNRGGFL
jgi:hypothetical protein